MEMQQNDLDILLQLDQWQSTFPDFTPKEVAEFMYKWLECMPLDKLTPKQKEWVLNYE